MTIRVAIVGPNGVGKYIVKLDLNTRMNIYLFI